MADDVQELLGAIRVRAPGKAFTRIPTPLGFTDLVFYNAVVCAYTFFVAKGRMPTPDDLHDAWPKIELLTYSGLFLTAEFKAALAYRGLPVDGDIGLSLEQQAALVKLADPTDRRGLKVRLNELGIPVGRYQAWLKQPLFRDALNRRTKELYADFLPELRNTLVSKAIDGDNAAMDKVLAITGEYAPQQQALLDARAVVLKVIDAVIEEADVETRKRILSKIQAAAVGFDLNNPRALEA